MVKNRVTELNIQLSLDLNTFNSTERKNVSAQNRKLLGEQAFFSFRKKDLFVMKYPERYLIHSINDTFNKYPKITSDETGMRASNHEKTLFGAAPIGTNSVRREITKPVITDSPNIREVKSEQPPELCHC